MGEGDGHQWLKKEKVCSQDSWIHPENSNFMGQFELFSSTLLEKSKIFVQNGIKYSSKYCYQRRGLCYIFEWKSQILVLASSIIELIHSAGKNWITLRVASHSC